MNPARHVPATAVVLATAGALLSTATADSSAATGCASPVYTRTFYANTTFSGTPRRTDCDSAVGETWSGSPATGLPRDNFGVRWTVTRDFGSGGPFTLAASGLDGIRVYLDGVRRIDLWKNTSTTVRRTVNVTIPKGAHTLRIDYVNWTGAANVKFTYTPITSTTADKVKPLAPTGTSAGYDQATGTARITWSRNKEMDLAGYRVYRRPANSATWTRLTTTTSTSYSDTTLPKTGEAYFYEVRAYDKAGNESAGGADKGVTTVDRVAPGVPAGVSAEGEVTPAGGTGGMRVGWDAVADAVSYRVYRAASENGTYTALGSTDQLAYLDTSAAESTVYYYRVSAVDAAGNESARSAPVDGRIWDNDPPALVTGLNVTPTEYGFELTWDKNPATDLRYYTVHQGELVGEPDDQVCYSTRSEYVSPDRTSFTVTTLPDGEESCFFVDAVDDENNSAIQWNGPAEAVITTELDLTPSVATPEGSPVRPTAAADEAGVALSWNTAADATGYRVYRWNRTTQAYEQLADVSGTSYEDTGAAKGTTHFYRVTALLADGGESAPGGTWAVVAP